MPHMHVHNYVHVQVHVHVHMHGIQQLACSQLVDPLAPLAESVETTIAINELI